MLPTSTVERESRPVTQLAEPLNLELSAWRSFISSAIATNLGEGAPPCLSQLAPLPQLTPAALEGQARH